MKFKKTPCKPVTSEACRTKCKVQSKETNRCNVKQAYSNCNLKCKLSIKSNLKRSLGNKFKRLCKLSRKGGDQDTKLFSNHDQTLCAHSNNEECLLPNYRTSADKFSDISMWLQQTKLVDKIKATKCNMNNGILQKHLEGNFQSRNCLPSAQVGRNELHLELKYRLNFGNESSELSLVKPVHLQFNNKKSRSVNNHNCLGLNNQPDIHKDSLQCSFINQGNLIQNQLECSQSFIKTDREGDVKSKSDKNQSECDAKIEIECDTHMCEIKSGVHADVQQLDCKHLENNRCSLKTLPAYHFCWYRNLFPVAFQESELVESADLFGIEHSNAAEGDNDYVSSAAIENNADITNVAEENNVDITRAAEETNDGITSASEGNNDAVTDTNSSFHDPWILQSALANPNIKNNANETLLMDDSMKHLKNNDLVLIETSLGSKGKHFPENEMCNQLPPSSIRRCHSTESVVSFDSSIQSLDESDSFDSSEKSFDDVNTNMFFSDSDAENDFELIQMQPKYLENSGKRFEPYSKCERFKNEKTLLRKTQSEEKSFKNVLNHNSASVINVGNNFKNECQKIQHEKIDKRTKSLDFSLEHVSNKRFNQSGQSLSTSLSNKDMLTPMNNCHASKYRTLSSSTEAMPTVTETVQRLPKQSNNNKDMKYFTIPRQQKHKNGYSPKRKTSGLSSLSKLLQVKAHSLSNLKKEASFKIRNDFEKSKLYLSSTSLSNLVAKKRAEITSSLTTLIKKRNNSNSFIESPFKQSMRKERKPKDELKFQLIYEKVLVYITRKWPPSAREQLAISKSLKFKTVFSQKSKTDFTGIDSISEVTPCPLLCRPLSSQSLSPVHTCTLLDEIMKSVDTETVRKLCSVSSAEAEELSGCDDSSDGSSVLLCQMQYDTESDDIRFRPCGQIMPPCRVCGKFKHYSNSSDESLNSPLQKLPRTSLSLCDLNSYCVCYKKDGNQQLSCLFPAKSVISADHFYSTEKNLNPKELLRKNGVVLQTRKSLHYSLTDVTSADIDYKTTVSDRQRDKDRMKYTFDSAAESPSLSRHKPVLDLSADELDEVACTTNEAIKQCTRSLWKRHSYSDMLESRTSQLQFSNPILSTMSVDLDMAIDDNDSESLHSCTELVNDTDIAEQNIEKARPNSCNYFVGLSDVLLGNNLKKKEGSTCRKTLRKVKVKSMSSSHDALVTPSETNEYLKQIGNRDNKINCRSVSEVYENGIENVAFNVQNNKKENTHKEPRSYMHSKSDSAIEHLCESCNRVRKNASQTNNHADKLYVNLKNNYVIAKPATCTKHVKCTSMAVISDREIQGCNHKVKSMQDLANMYENLNICTCKKINGEEIVFNKYNTLPQESAFSTNKGTQFICNKHVTKTINLQNKLIRTDRKASVSCDHIKIVNQQHSFSEKPGSAFSFNLLSRKSCFDTLSFSKEPQLLPLRIGTEPFPLNECSGLTRILSPMDKTNCSTFEEVPIVKYDVSLGYLLHSIQCDNKMICIYSLQRNKQMMESVITPLVALPGSPHARSGEFGSKQKTTHHKSKVDDLPNPADPITNVPSDHLTHAGRVLRTVLLARAPHMIRDRKFHLRTYRRCMVGTEMVDWLLQQSTLVHSRTQAVGMWQALVEEGAVVHVCHEHQFKDKYLFYRFQEDDEGISTTPTNTMKRECEDDMPDVFLMLAQIGPDAMMRMILRKLPHERTNEDLEIIYEELLHIKALSHLSTMVKRELASVLLFESHTKAGTVLFNQGDEGKSWYIILKGSVNVVIYGKGVVCTLHEGDDFGKLALVNDAPRAATIVSRDDHCHFLRVDKDDFNRILRDVEANTVRLKEHDRDVLILEKIPSNMQTNDGSLQSHYKYSVMAGTPDKMLEHILDSRLDNKNETEIDNFLEDFILTHVIFLPCESLCPRLLQHYHSSTNDQSSEQDSLEFMLNHKKCVLHFVQEWASIVGSTFKENGVIDTFVEELCSCVRDDLQVFPSLKEDLIALESMQNSPIRSPGKLPKRTSGSFNRDRRSFKNCFQDLPRKLKPIKPFDETIVKVYCADHTYCTLKLPMCTKVDELLESAKEKLYLGDDLILCEVKCTGERIIFKPEDLCVMTGLSINGRLFVTPKEHLDALTPLPEQEGPSEGTFNTIELFSSREMAYHTTLHDWELFTCVQEYELIYHVFGRYKFGKITANLDLFLKRFNEIQFWVVTEMVLTANLSKRVSLLRKFIKLAAHCKEYNNLNSFFAVVMGLSNIAVSRLSQTWEKLPSKFKKMFADFETLMDPSRNHRVYRLTVAKMQPPIIPFMPLLMKDMTFTHEGNKTHFEGLVNFEKMHMISQTLKTVRFCRSARLEIEPPGTIRSADVADYICDLRVIDNQRLLTQLSHKLEPRKT